jgi:hypothetical protein
MLKSFMKDLGAVSTSFGVIQTALRVFITTEFDSSNNWTRTATRHVRLIGHRNLNLSAVNPKDLEPLVFKSANALIWVCFEKLCNDIMANVPAEMKTGLEGDPFDRTIRMLSSRFRVEHTGLSLDHIEGVSRLDDADVETIKKGKLHRNVDFHGKKKSSSKNKLTVADRNMSYEDLISFSESLQRVARILCLSHGLICPNLGEVLERKYGGQNEARRRNASSAFLAQEFLLDVPTIDRVLAHLGWLA